MGRPMDERWKMLSSVKLEKYLGTSFNFDADATIVFKTCF